VLLPSLPFFERATLRCALVWAGNAVEKCLWWWWWTGDLRGGVVLGGFEVVVVIVVCVQ
jgi:hypothetical protein